MNVSVISYDCINKYFYRSNAPRWNASEDAPASSFQSVFY